MHGTRATLTIVAHNTCFSQARVAEQSHARALADARSISDSLRASLEQRVMGAERSAQQLGTELALAHSALARSTSQAARIGARLEQSQSDAAAAIQRCRDEASAALAARDESAAVRSELSATRTALASASDAAAALSARLESAFAQLVALASAHQHVQAERDAARAESTEYAVRVSELERHIVDQDARIRSLQLAHTEQESAWRARAERDASALAEASAQVRMSCVSALLSVYVLTSILPFAFQIERCNARLREYEDTLSKQHDELQQKNDLIVMIHNLAAKSKGAQS